MQAMSMFTHPADLFARVAYYQRIGRNRFCNHSTRPNESIFPDFVSANNGGICPDARSFSYERPQIFMFATHRTSRVDDVGKYHRWSEENIIFADHSFIDRNIILYANIFSKD